MHRLRSSARLKRLDLTGQGGDWICLLNNIFVGYREYSRCMFAVPHKKFKRNLCVGYVTPDEAGQYLKYNNPLRLAVSSTSSSPSAVPTSLIVANAGGTTAALSAANNQRKSSYLPNDTLLPNLYDCFLAHFQLLRIQQRQEQLLQRWALLMGPCHGKRSEVLSSL